MPFISIDGDDIGQKIVSRHLANDAEGLSAAATLIHEKVKQIGRLLSDSGYTIIFSAADGVVAYKEGEDISLTTNLYSSIKKIGDDNITFSAGVGMSLREAYIALMSAKANGKARLCIFSEML